MAESNVLFLQSNDVGLLKNLSDIWKETQGFQFVPPCYTQKSDLKNVPRFYSEVQEKGKRESQDG